jgi:hypothetical protein
MKMFLCILAVWLPTATLGQTSKTRLVGRVIEAEGREPITGLEIA